MNRVKYTLLIVCMMVWGSAVFPLAALQAGDTIAGITGVESLSSREIQEIVAILAAEPGIEPVKDGKRRLRELISGFNDKIAAAEKEINQLRTALEGIDREESKGQPVMNQALAGLISLKQQKELELVHWRLLSLTAEEAFQKLDQYLQRQASRDNHYRAAPFWEVFSDMVRGSAVDEQIDDQPRPGGTLFIMAVAATFFFSLSLFPGVRSFVEKNGNAGNGVHILFGRLSRLTPVIRWTMGVAVFSVLALNLALPVFPDRYNLAAAILTIFFFFVIRLLLQVVILRFKPAVAGGSGNSSGGNEELPALFIFSLLSAIVVVCSSDYTFRFTVPGLSVILDSLIFICWLGVLYGFVHRCCIISGTSAWNFLRWPMFLLVILIGFLDLFGYRNLTDHLTVVFGLTCVILGFALLLYDSIDILIELLRRGKDLLLGRLLETPLEKSTGIKTRRILGVGLKVYVVLGAFILLLHHWGITNTDNERLVELFFEGTSFSGITVSPARITLALLLFILIWPTIEYGKHLLERGWLMSADMSQSARDTFLTVSGYAGYGIVILLALSVAGIKMTGLTVIIGALSVGIGFGLQNIVNNFISGLILMFERPIKKGDWILVGTTEGYVKKISIRSTIVQTFDRADVIVPNSELISNQVTNMMFEDVRGRLRVSVGVAYGSDTELVQRLLLEVAHAHKQVITDGSTPPPRAWFQEFGDSSLNFDLLCHLKDIDMKLQVRSELHTAIDKAFRQHGIEIPFPQRDVHLKGSQFNQQQEG